MAFNFDPKFENWLDEKLHQIRTLGLQAARPILGHKAQDEVDDLVLGGRSGLDEVEEMDDVSSVTSETESNLPLRNGTQKGDYYHLMWNEGVDPTADDLQGERRLSARERVEKILRETELKTATKDPYSMTYIEDEGDDAYYADSGRYSYEAGGSSSGRGSSKEGSVEEPLETRHDVMESGYIQISRIPNKARDEMFDAWEYDDEFGMDDEQFMNRESGDGQADTAAKDPQRSPLQGDDVQIRFRKFKTDIEEIQGGDYIMDEEYKDTKVYPEEQEPTFKSSSFSKGQPMLPMDTFGHSSEDEAILDVTHERDVIVDVTDTQPIVTVDQAQLTEQWTKRRRRIMISVMTLSTMVGVGAFCAIVYFVVHFLSER